MTFSSGILYFKLPLEKRFCKSLTRLVLLLTGVLAAMNGLGFLFMVLNYWFWSSATFSPTPELFLTSAAASEATEADIASAPLQGRELTAYWAMTHVMDVVKCLCCRLVWRSTRERHMWSQATLKNVNIPRRDFFRQHGVSTLAHNNINESLSGFQPVFHKRGNKLQWVVVSATNILHINTCQ